MIDVSEICGPSEPWARKHGGDTPAQAQLRGCLIAILADLDPLAQIAIGAELVDLMRDELMPAASSVRKAAATFARTTMRPAAIAAGSGQSPQTISRLLAKQKARQDS